MAFNNRHMKTAGGKAKHKQTVIVIVQCVLNNGGKGFFTDCFLCRKDCMGFIRMPKPQDNRYHDKERDSGYRHGRTNAESGDERLQPWGHQRIAYPGAGLHNPGNNRRPLFSEYRCNGAHHDTEAKAGGPKRQDESEKKEKREKIPAQGCDYQTGDGKQDSQKKDKYI